MKKPEEFPTDESASLKPNKIIYIYAPKQFSRGIIIHDVTTLMKRTYAGLTDEYIDEVKSLAKDLKPESAVYTFKKKHWLSSNSIIRDVHKTQIAELSAPLIALGTRKFIFPNGSPHASHQIEMRQVGIRRRAGWFAKDSVLYFWDVENRSTTHKVLYKVVGAMKVEIGKYATKHVWDGSGVLVLDTEQLDELVAVVSTVASLEQLDSFTR
jgi:hypothetical protein